MGTMKAVRFYEYGGPEVLRYENAPRPEPKEGEILVRVHAAGVNPVDWKMIEGRMKERLPLALPHVAGRDFSGTIERMGPGVSGLAVGDDVFGRPSAERDGPEAQFVIVRADEIAKKPAGLDHARAAAIPTAGLAAWQALFDRDGEPMIALSAGQTVLIHGAAGGVGSFAVQLAKWKGAKVIATAAGRHRSYVSDLGADVVVDYEKERFENVARDVDAVLDPIGGETQRRSIEVIRSGGILVSLVGIVAAERAQERGVRAKTFMSTTNSHALCELARLAGEGVVKVEISDRLPLEKAAEAYAHNREGHTQGKIVLEVAS